MKETDPQEIRSFNIEELSDLTGISRRNIRYYIQIGLIEGPCGERKGAYYTEDHLEELLKIKRLSSKHIPLNTIALMLKSDDEEIKETAHIPGSIEIKSHISLTDGIELVVDHKKAKIDTRDLRQLALKILNLINEENPVK